MAKDRFAKDLEFLLQQLDLTTDSETMTQLDQICNRLVELRKKRLVKINHSVMQVLCAKFLIEQGYRTNVEYPLEGGKLIADIFAIRERSSCSSDELVHKMISEKHNLPYDKETLVVEIETGFVPPKAALYPVRYRQTRITAKIARYSGHSHCFALATPSFHVLQIPSILLKKPELRDSEYLHRLKEICDIDYKSPPVLLDTLKKAFIDKIYIINVDDADVTQISPLQYLDTILRAEGTIPIVQ